MRTKMYTTAYKRSHGPDQVKELSHMIDVHHEDFLAAASPENKADALRLMRGYAAQFLYQVSHDHKFRLTETERVLSQSVASIADFDPREASLAFENLAIYAHNLLEQPWRREFRTLKLTSGYWYHNIKAHLQNAQEMLITLGYVGTDDYTLQLTGSVDPFILKGLSRDCYVASQECLILSQIWERVQREIPDYPLTVYEAYETRKNILGDTQTIVTHLIYEARQRQQKAHEELELKQRFARLQQLENEQKVSRRAQNHVEAKRAQHGFVPVDRLIDVDDEHTETEREIVNRVLKNTEKQNQVKQRKLYSTAANSDDRLNCSSAASAVSISGSDSSLKELGEVFYDSFLQQVNTDDSRCDSNVINQLLERHKINVTKVDSVTTGRQRKGETSSTRPTSKPKPDHLGRVYDTPPPIRPTLYSVPSEKPDGNRSAGDVRSHINGSEAEDDSYSLLHDAPTAPPSYLDALSQKAYEAPGTSHTMSTSSSFKSLKHHQDLPKATIASNQPPAANGGNSILSKFSGLMGIGTRSEKTEKPTTSSSTVERESRKPTALSKSRVPAETETKFESEMDDGCFANHNFPALVPSVTPTSIKLEQLFLNDSDSDEASRNTKTHSSKSHYEKEVNLNTNTVHVKQDRDKDIGISRSRPGPSPSEGRKSTQVPTKVEPWNCIHCTFRNEQNASICEICSKTKDLVLDILPSPVPPDLDFSDIDGPSPTPIVDKLNASGEWTEVKSFKDKKNGKSKGQPGEVRSYPSSYYPTKVSTVNETDVKGKNKVKTNGYSSSSGSSRERETSQHALVECRKCTLLNPARSTHCEACDERLTYHEYEGTLT